MDQPRREIFGVPLGKSVTEGFVVPDVIDLSLQVLDYCVPCGRDLFAVTELIDRNDNLAKCEEDPTCSEVFELKEGFEVYDPLCDPVSPVALVSDPSILTGVIALFFKMLPHPLVPMKFYSILLKTDKDVTNAHKKALMMRILVQKMPIICTQTFIRFLKWLRSTSLPLDYLLNIFGKYILRNTKKLPDRFQTPPDVVSALTFIVENIDFIAFEAATPEGVGGADGEFTFSDDSFTLQGIAITDADPSCGESVAYKKDDIFTLISLHNADWIEVITEDCTCQGFVRAAVIDIILSESYYNDLSAAAAAAAQQQEVPPPPPPEGDGFDIPPPPPPEEEGINDGMSLEMQMQLQLQQLQQQQEQALEQIRLEQQQFVPDPGLVVDPHFDQEKIQEEQERLRQEQERLRIENERLEQERLEKERLERERLEKERLERERLEKERLEKERLEKERLERERLERERLEKERLEQERLEKERLEQERLEQERLEQERLEKERLEQERLEQERLEKERLEKERMEKERMEQERRAKMQSPRVSQPPGASPQGPKMQGAPMVKKMVMRPKVQTKGIQQKFQGQGPMTPPSQGLQQTSPPAGGQPPMTTKKMNPKTCMRAKSQTMPKSLSRMPESLKVGAESDESFDFKKILQRQQEQSQAQTHEQQQQQQQNVLRTKKVAPKVQVKMKPQKQGFQGPVKAQMGGQAAAAGGGGAPPTLPPQGPQPGPKMQGFGQAPQKPQPPVPGMSSSVPNSPQHQRRGSMQSNAPYVGVKKSVPPGFIPPPPSPATSSSPSSSSSSPYIPPPSSSTSQLAHSASPGFIPPPPPASSKPSSAGAPPPGFIPPPPPASAKPSSPGAPSSGFIPPPAPFSPPSSSAQQGFIPPPPPSAQPQLGRREIINQHQNDDYNDNEYYDKDDENAKGGKMDFASKQRSFSTIGTSTPKSDAGSSSSSTPARPGRPERKGRAGAGGAGAPAALRFKTVRKVPDNFVPGMSLSSAKGPAVKKAAPPPPPPISARRKECMQAAMVVVPKNQFQPPAKQLPMQPPKQQQFPPAIQRKNVAGQMNGQFGGGNGVPPQKPVPPQKQQPMGAGNGQSFQGNSGKPINFAQEILTMQQQMISNQQQQLQFLFQSQKLEQKKLGAQQQFQLQHAKSPQERQALTQQHMMERQQMIQAQQQEQHELTQQHMKEMQLFMQRQQQMMQIDSQANFGCDDGGFGNGSW